MTTPRTGASTVKTGPLAGLKVIEMAGLGPVPLAALMLSEMGAEVLRIERADAKAPLVSLPEACDLDRHGRSILKLDLKRPDGAALLLRLAQRTDILIEGFRPGVMERLGLGPDIVLDRNPALIYGRLTGFGQDGPLSCRAGHDITYLAYAGLLHAIGRQGEPPVPPLNLVADQGGGAMMLIAGVLAALFQRSRTGKGEVVDAAMIEGASMLAAPIHAFMAAGLWSDRRGENLLDSGAPFYDTYETADGRHVAIGCLEPQFFAEFAALLPLDQHFVRGQYDRTLWPGMRAAIAGRISQKTRDEWADVFGSTDACVAPVLSLREARDHPQGRARQSFVKSDELQRPAPAPRFSHAPPMLAAAPTVTDCGPADVLARFGVDESEIETLVRSGLFGQ
ncbi:CoA transferase [Mesorhizobium sp. M1C.F.Ca.ET.193.01.1.1]|uniref:CaiB/BaiF CoA transferase family protein n=1 Tax=unclassified Mesorhizobium TaxID=325217 RepID=UPI000FD5647A|nr:MULTISPECIES: CaiB/BaiF CoA-transferase family protein [unclassified Mesorhizobium]TGS93981.1 CoA transferase [bacterium M00.F.Ca.ET.177.01.1.1]TGQ51049.1 CoA transferase [Mesorhizobium sp. M1C.F.Ca.ET.210.01.1.1]TGQ66480.1 CoA transferase [Mesorhizobium sp. M1C.F.Ca.ET.212.01.1.1]TGR00876.1 CoA transferase [Mesorhizobium sp. M1C.F.Ca.ET.204.01.1.1]TGR21151.1 CoA transferase [Mesorhizobium sp. M1C.F.Ca.ET.196.01.1.1]